MGKTNRYMLSVLTTADCNQQTATSRRTRNGKKIAVVMRDISELYQAQGNLQIALEYAINSSNLFRSERTITIDDNCNSCVDVKNNNNDNDIVSFIEEETNALLLVGSLHHELCNPVQAQIAFSEINRLIHSTLFSSSIASSAATKQQHIAAAATTLI